MNFKNSFFPMFVAIQSFCLVTGCRNPSESEEVDYCQLVKLLQIGPYVFTDEVPYKIAFTIFNDANSEIARQGYSRSIGIVLQTSGDKFSDKSISISIPRGTILEVLKSLGNEIGCTASYDNGVVRFSDVEQ